MKNVMQFLAVKNVKLTAGSQWWSYVRTVTSCDLWC